MAQVIRGAAVVTTQCQRLVVVCLKKTTFAGALQQRYSHSHRQSQAKGALRLPRQVQLEKKEKEKDEEDKRKSRNQLKKEAHEAVRCGMDLASLSIPQIKRILQAASLGEELFEALVVVKWKTNEMRRELLLLVAVPLTKCYNNVNSIRVLGKLLRDAQPDLLQALIQATKAGDLSRFQSLADSVKLVNNGPEQELYETESESESELQPEDSCEHLTLATRWFDGFIKKDIQISKEVYSVNSVEFDRQELRRLVRNVHYIQDHPRGDEQDSEGTAALAAATNSLRCFLISLAKRVSISSNLPV